MWNKTFRYMYSVSFLLLCFLMSWSRLGLKVVGSPLRQRGGYKEQLLPKAPFRIQISSKTFPKPTSVFFLCEKSALPPPCASYMSKRASFFWQKGTCFLRVCFVSHPHLTALWNVVKGAFFECVCRLCQMAARGLGCLYYVSSDFMSLNNKL